MMMKAAVYSSFSGPITVQSIPRPTLSSNNNDGVILQVMATGVCRSDHHGWKAHDSDIQDYVKKNGFPFVPGHEVSGIIIEAGNNVQKFKVGDRVAVPFILSCGKCNMCCQHSRPTICERQEQPGFTMLGSYAEYVAIPRADYNLSIIPNEVSFVEAAALGCRFTTAYRAVVQQGGLGGTSNYIQSIAIFGCGGLGLSCIMIASAYGGSHLQIIAVDVSDKALDKAKEVGATHIINARSEDVQQCIMNLTNKNGTVGVDLSIDAAGFKATCENAVYATRRGGRMIQVGLPIGHKPPIIPMGVVAGKELEIVGSHGCAGNDMPAILSLVKNKKLDPKKLIEREVTLEEGAQTLMSMDNGSPIGMVMITQFDNVPNSRY